MEKSNIIKIKLNEFIEEDSIKIFKHENSFISKNERIGEYRLTIGNKFPIISPDYAQILKIDKDNKEIVLEKCRHEVVYYNLCSSCGFKTTNKTINNNSSQISDKQNTSSYMAISKVFKFTEERAKNEEIDILQKYLEKRKLILLLDIDNTILHSSTLDINQNEFDILKETHPKEIFEIRIKPPNIGHNANYKQRIIIKLRPNLKEFFENIKEKYEIYVYTQGTRNYAEEIIKKINEIFYSDSKSEEKILSTDRLVAREDHLTEFKTIKRIFPTTEDMVVILDDRTDVWVHNRQNLINLYPYFFFYDEKYCLIQDKFKKSEDDKILLSIDKLLNFINQVFYYYYDNNHNRRADVKLILENKINKILNGLGFNFSGMFGKDVDIFKSRPGIIIDYLGGKLFDEYDQEINIIITHEYKSKFNNFNIIETNKIINAKKDNKLILHDSWLDFCLLFFTRIDYGDFILTNEKRILDMSQIRQTDIYENNKSNFESIYSMENVIKLSEILKTG